MKVQLLFQVCLIASTFWYAPILPKLVRVTHNSQTWKVNNKIAKLYTNYTILHPRSLQPLVRQLQSTFMAKKMIHVLAHYNHVLLYTKLPFLALHALHKIAIFSYYRTCHFFKSLYKNAIFRKLSDAINGLYTHTCYTQNWLLPDMALLTIIQITLQNWHFCKVIGWQSICT